MKKYIAITFLLLSYSSIQAKIVHDLNKYGILIVHFVSEEKMPTIEMFQEDCETAVDIASSNPKIIQIQFKNNQNELIAWIEKDKLSNWHKDFEDLIKGFSSFDEYDVIYGDSVLVRRTIPAKYHIDTYHNGKLESTYVSDWKGGYLAPSSSEYVSGNTRIVSKTYVTPSKIESHWEKPIIGRNLIRKGETIKLLEIYSYESKK